MLRRRSEPVRFAFIPDAQRFRSDVRPPLPPHRRVGEAAGRVLVGILVVAGLVGAVLFGVPALEVSDDPGSARNDDTVQTP